MGGAYIKMKIKKGSVKKTICHISVQPVIHAPELVG
jgi:hypothetical protein